jgi:hypothetical protein
VGRHQWNACQGMEVGVSEVEDFIEQYKRELVAEAELARDDLREIEDHLRTLTAELRESGLSSGDAERLACERLGNPRAVAHEHARVSTPFGARLSWARTISAAALLLVFVVRSYVFMWTSWDRIPIQFLFSGTSILCTVLVVALLARLTWARAVVVGAVGFTVILGLVTEMAPGTSMLLLIPLAGAVLFVMPWRRNELRGAGYVIALQAFAFGAMAFAAGTLGADIETLGQHPELPSSGIHMAPASLIGLFPALVAIVGSITRARWAALASAFGAAMLSVSVIEVVRYHVGFHQIEYTGDWLPFASMVFAGALASAIAAVASWRSARSTAGTLRYVLR